MFKLLDGRGITGFLLGDSVHFLPPVWPSRPTCSFIQEVWEHLPERERNEQGARTTIEQTLSYRSSQSISPSVYGH